MWRDATARAGSDPTSLPESCARPFSASTSSFRSTASEMRRPVTLGKCRCLYDMSRLASEERRAPRSRCCRMHLHASAALAGSWPGAGVNRRRHASGATPVQHRINGDTGPAFYWITGWWCTRTQNARLDSVRPTQAAPYWPRRSSRSRRITHDAEPMSCRAETNAAASPGLSQRLASVSAPT